MIPNKTIINAAKVLFVILCVIQAAKLSARQDNSFCKVSYKDSLVADARTRIIYNNLSVTNTYHQPIMLTIHIAMPGGWRLLSDEAVTMSLGIGEKQILPLSIIRLPEAAATWKAVYIDIKRGAGEDKAEYSFHVRATSQTGFGVYSFVDNINIPEEDQAADIPLKITNTGNIPGIYTMTWVSNEMGIEDKVTMLLASRRDTQFIYTFKIPRDHRAAFKKARLDVTITDTAGHTYSHIFHLTKSRNEQKMHASRYATFPLTVEGGLLNLNKQLTYYGALRGEAVIDSYDRLSFAYNSKQFGNYNSFQRNLWHVEYDHKNWRYYAGKITDSRFFALYNTGGKISYKWNKEGEVSFSASLHDNLPYNSGYYNNDNATASVKYAVRKLVFTHLLTANINNDVHFNSYIFWNNVRLLKSRHLTFEVHAGAGLDHSTVYRSSLPAEKWGTSLGFQFSYTYHGWDITSDMQENSKSFPGLFKGLRVYTENIYKQLGNVRVGLFYVYNYNQTNFFLDTAFRTDVFSTNVTKYGISTGWTGRHLGISLQAGMLKQVGLSDAVAPEYPFAEASFSYWRKNFNFRLNSLVGYSNRNGDTTEDIFLNNTSAAISYKFLGVQGLYTRTPDFNAKDTRPVSGYRETYDYGPFVNFRIGKYFSANLMYEVSQSTYDNLSHTFLRGSLNYFDLNRGLSIRLFGMLPLQSSTPETIAGLNSRYVMLNISKRFDMPVFVKRKYFALKVVAYFDKNSNGIRDNGEELLANVSIEVNGTIFVTDEKGEFYYENLEKGTYSIDLHNIRNVKGIIPFRGFTQSVNVQGNTTYEIPFKKAKVISGSIKVILDSLSPAQFTPDYLKVTATDTTGEAFTTVTDKDGEFYFNLPAGLYALSLNPRAFNEILRPMRMGYKVDLVHNDEAIVLFEIDQKSREIRLRTFKIDNSGK